MGLLTLSPVTIANIPSNPAAGSLGDLFFNTGLGAPVICTNATGPVWNQIAKVDIAGLTSTRIPFAGTNGVLGDSANLSYTVGTLSTGHVDINNTTASSASTSGALVVAGGVGIGGNLYTGSNIFGGAAFVASAGNYYVNTVPDSFGFSFRTTGAVVRWHQFITGAESTGDLGSSWVLRAYTDAGVTIDNALVVPRLATGYMTVARKISQTINLNTANDAGIYQANSSNLVSGAAYTQQPILSAVPGAASSANFVACAPTAQTTSALAFNITGALYGVQAAAVHTSSNAASVTTMIGIQGMTYTSNSAVATNAIGGNFQAYTLNTSNVSQTTGIKAQAGSLSATATTGAAVGVQILAPFNTGVVGTNYGIHIADQKPANITTGYGIYIAAQSNTGYAIYTAGAGIVLISDTTAATTTSTGAVRISGGLGVAGAIWGQSVNSFGGVIQATRDDTGPAQIIIRGASNNNQQLLIGYNTTSDFGAIQAVLQGTGYKELKLNPSGGLVSIGVGGLSITGTMTVNFTDIQTATLTTTAVTAGQVISSIAVATYRSCKYIIQAVDATGTKYHTTEILAVHDGTNVSYTEYGAVYTANGICGTFSVDVSGGNMRLLVTPSSANSTVFRVTLQATDI